MRIRAERICMSLCMHRPRSASSDGDADEDRGHGGGGWRTTDSNGGWTRIAEGSALRSVPAQLGTSLGADVDRDPYAGSLPVVAYSRRAALPRTAAPARPLETRQCSLARLYGLIPRLVLSFSHFRRVLLGLLVRAGDSVFDAPPARASHSAEGAPADAPVDGDDVIMTSAPRRPPRNAERDDVCAGGRVDVRLV